MRKIKWINVIKAIILLISIGIILHDIFMLTIYNFIGNNGSMITWYGLITFIFVLCIANMILEDFKEQIKSIPNRPKFKKDTM